MSRKKSKRKGDSKFTKLLGTTVTVALVFSAGLITGQRLVNQDNVPPLVSLSVTNEAQAASLGDHEKQPAKSVRTTFSFYDELAKPLPDLPDALSAAPSLSKKMAAKPKPRVAHRPKPVEVKVAQEDKPANGVSAAEIEPQTPAKVVQVPVKTTAVVPKVAESTKSGEPLPARYALQVGSHTSRAAATRELSRLRAQGLEAQLITVRVPEKGRFYRVRVGKFHTMDEVRGFQAELKEKRGINAMITPL